MRSAHRATGLCAPGGGKGYPCYMLGMSGYNTENLTANHSGARCWGGCLVSRTLENPSVVFSRSGNHRAPPQEAKLPDPTHPSFFQWQSKYLALLSLYPIPHLYRFPPLFVAFFHVNFKICERRIGVRVVTIWQEKTQERNYRIYLTV